MKKILSLLSFLMLAVVAMAADIATGVTFKGTWSSPQLSDPIEGQMKVTKVDGGLKFEVKSYAFKGTAIPDYVINYEGGVGDDGSFSNASGFTLATDFGETTAEGTALAPVSAYWQYYNGTVTNEAITLTIGYFGYGTLDCAKVTFTGTAVAGETPSTPEPKAYKNVLNIVRVNDAKISYPNAEVLVLDKGEGKYAVTLPEFTDLDGNVDNCVGKLTFEANGVEEEGKIKLTANNVVTGKPEGGSVDWTDATYSVEMDATIEGETIVGKITLKLVNGDPADGYEYTLTFGENPDKPAAEPVDYTNVLMLKSLNGDTHQFVENNKLTVLEKGEGKYQFTVRGVVDKDETPVGDIVFEATGVEENGKITYTAENVTSEPLSDAWAEYTAIISDFNAESQEGALKATFKLELGTGFGDEYKYDVTYDNIDPNQVVANKTYSDNLTVGHDRITGEVKGYANKQVEFTKYINGESTVTFKEYPISEKETRDLTFRGIIAEYDMSDLSPDGGTMIFGDMVMTPIEDETSAFYGKEISLVINISSYSTEKIKFTYEFGADAEEGETEGIYYAGQYGVEIEKPEIQKFIENWKSTSASGEKANVEIATASDGKVSMTVNVDDRTITADDLTQGKDEKDRVTYTGKAVDADMNEYDVKAVVYGAGDLQRIYMTLTNGEFVYTIGEDPDLTNGINGIETEMENGNVSIYTVGGAKLNTLHKGINIVRLANGKTIKVIK